jgi:DNA-binding response OmpR family regulator
MLAKPSIVVVANSLRAMERDRCFERSRPCCLIVEDQPLICLMLEAEMEAAGFDVPANASSIEEALARLNEDAPDVAVIDVMLQGHPATGLARELRQRGIPFVVHTGYEPGVDLASENHRAPWITKPTNLCDLLDAVRA